MTDIYGKYIIIYMTFTAQTFQLGFSTVVTLPKKLGIQPGKTLKFTQKRGGFNVKEEKMTEQEVDKLIKRLSGKMLLDRHLNPDELNKALDEEYDKMLP